MDQDYFTREWFVRRFGFNNFNMEKNGEKEFALLAHSMCESSSNGGGGFVCIDVGMNMGEYSEMLLSSVPGCRIVGIEAINEYAEKARYRLGSSVEIINIGLSNDNSGIKIGKLNNGGRADLRQHSGPDVFDCRVIESRSITLDELVRSKNIHNLSLLKIDCDGFELPIIKGASETISNLRPIVQFEYSCFWQHTKSHLTEALELFTSANYQVYIMSGNSLIPLGPEAGPYDPFLEVVTMRFELNINIGCIPAELIRNHKLY